VRLPLHGPLILLGNLHHHAGRFQFRHKDTHYSPELLRFAVSLFAIHDSLLGEAAWTVAQSFLTVPTPVCLR
jgi:hypothetical protein